MEPKERARLIYNKYSKLLESLDGLSPYRIKQCGLFLCDEMLSHAGFIWGGRNTETGLTARDEYRKYWNEVKSEIEKL